MIYRDSDDELYHYASKYYDPVKAHEYYMKNRKLKGRPTGSLTDEGKEIWKATKANIDSEKKTEIMEENLVKEQKITALKATAESSKIQITNKLKELNDALNAKYKTDTKALSDSQKEQLEAIKRKRESEKEQLIKTKQNKIKKIREDDDMDSEEKSEEIADITESTSKQTKDISEKATQESKQIRERTSAKRSELSETKKIETSKNRENAQVERKKIATDLKNAVELAKAQYADNKNKIIDKYEDVYQDEYEKIKSQYTKPKKRKK